MDRYAVSSLYARPIRDCRKVGVDNNLDLHGQGDELGGIMIHLGTSVNSGHYISCVVIQGEWYICNDSLIQKVKSLPENSGDAYLLFFIKQQST